MVLLYDSSLLPLLPHCTVCAHDYTTHPSWGLFQGEIFLGSKDEPHHPGATQASHPHTPTTPAPTGQCHSNKEKILKGRIFEREGEMPGLLAMKGGTGAFDDARTEAQAPSRQQGSGGRQVSQQTTL